MTGESLAVDKYCADVVYYTTGCKRGKAYAVVTHSAKMSFVGRTASLVSGAKDQGHFKAIMNSIGTSLLVLVVAWILISWIGGFYHHLSIATPESSSMNLLHFALILLIVGVPVGLPVVTTTTLAVGAAYLAKEKAIVQKLTAIESLAVSCPAPTSILKPHAKNHRASMFSAPTKLALSPPTSSASASPLSLKVSTSTG
jgi:H+-transporting ATPase